MTTIAIYKTKDSAHSEEAEPLFPSVHHAAHCWSRLRGLLGRPRLQDDEGLLLSPCNQIHTLGMRYALDVVFLDKAGTVLKCVENLRPFRVAGALRARHALELAPGTIARHGIEQGHQLSWSQVVS